MLKMQNIPNDKNTQTLMAAVRTLFPRREDSEDEGYYLHQDSSLSAAHIYVSDKIFNKICKLFKYDNAWALKIYTHKDVIATGTFYRVKEGFWINLTEKEVILILKKLAGKQYPPDIMLKLLSNKAAIRRKIINQKAAKYDEYDLKVHKYIIDSNSYLFSEDWQQKSSIVDFRLFSGKNRNYIIAKKYQACLGEVFQNETIQASHAQHIGHFLLSITEAILILQKKGIVHTDIYEKNVVMDTKKAPFTYKLIDFGNGELLNNEMQLVSLRKENFFFQQAPERYSEYHASRYEQNITTSMAALIDQDVWSLGICTLRSVLTIQENQKISEGIKKLVVFTINNPNTEVTTNEFQKHFTKIILNTMNDCKYANHIHTYSRVIEKMLKLDPFYRYSNVYALYIDILLIECKKNIQNLGDSPGKPNETAFKKEIANSLIKVVRICYICEDIYINLIHELCNKILQEPVITCALIQIIKLKIIPFTKKTSDKIDNEQHHLIHLGIELFIAIFIHMKYGEYKVDLLKKTVEAIVYNNDHSCDIEDMADNKFEKYGENSGGIHFWKLYGIRREKTSGIKKPITSIQVNKAEVQVLRALSLHNLNTIEFDENVFSKK